MENLDKIKKFLEEVCEKSIHFKEHFYIRIKDRPIDENLVRKYLKKTDRLLRVEQQKSRIEGEEKYKLWIKLSNRYNLIVVAAISEQHLYIITAWNSDRKWQKQQ